MGKINDCNCCGYAYQKCHRIVRLIGVEGRVLISRQEMVCHPCGNMFNNLRKEMEEFDKAQHEHYEEQVRECDCWLIPLLEDEKEN
jgi:hypothetical protein